MAKYGYKKNGYNVVRTRSGSSPRKKSGGGQSAFSRSIGNKLARGITRWLFK